MSNTYQQLVTAPDIHDIKAVLERYGDCRVGTNSPFAINRKTKGKLSSWLCWLLLVGTSLVRNNMNLTLKLLFLTDLAQ